MIRRAFAPNLLHLFRVRLSAQALDIQPVDKSLDTVGEVGEREFLGGTKLQ